MKTPNSLSLLRKAQRVFFSCAIFLITYILTVKVILSRDSYSDEVKMNFFIFGCIIGFATAASLLFFVFAYNKHKGYYEQN